MMAIVMTEEERKRLWEAGPTDVDALARQADRLSREVRQVIAASGHRGRTPAARQESEEDITYLLGDLRSSASGARMGKQWAHDSFRLAAHLGVGVEHVPLVQLQDGGRPRVTITGRIWRLPGRPPFVQLADTLREPERSRVLAHELGHALGFKAEEHAERFADAFLRVDDTERPGAAWRKIQDELLHRERQRQVSRHKALQAAASRH